MFDKERSRQELEQMKRETSILEYAERMGFTLVKKGRYYSTKEHDSLIIDPEKNCFYHNSETGGLHNHAPNTSGSIINFIAHFEGRDPKDVTAQLMRDWKAQNPGRTTFNALPIQAEKTKEAVEFQLPKRENTTRNVYAYLTQSRNISPTVVQSFINRKLLYQDKQNNCVFVGYSADGKPSFACRRGTNTAKKFVGDVPGCDYTHCMYLSHNTDRLIVSESPIDAMSIMTFMEKKGKDPKSYNYLILSGTNKMDALETITKENPNIQTVILALDNDDAGRKAGNTAVALLSQQGFTGKVMDFYPPMAKDWNDELQIENHLALEQKREISQPSHQLAR